MPPWIQTVCTSRRLPFRHHEPNLPSGWEHVLQLLLPYGAAGVLLVLRSVLLLPAQASTGLRTVPEVRESLRPRRRPSLPEQPALSLTIPADVLRSSNSRWL
jgi:hypothetical protein